MPGHGTSAFRVATFNSTQTAHHMDITGAIAIIFFFGSVFGIFYIYFSTRHRERMNMIDKGLAPGLHRPMTDHLRTLKNGMVLIGLGAGVLAGHLFSQATFVPGNDNPLPYIVGMAIFGGLSMVLFYTFFGRRQQG
jgi:hypothetical protein